MMQASMKRSQEQAEVTKFYQEGTPSDSDEINERIDAGLEVPVEARRESVKSIQDKG